MQVETHKTNVGQGDATWQLFAQSLPGGPKTPAELGEEISAPGCLGVSAPGQRFCTCLGVSTLVKEVSFCVSVSKSRYGNAFPTASSNSGAG